MVSISMRPEEIEQESFRIIDAEAEPHGWPDAEWGIIRRVIHTSADFDYARTMILSNGVIKAAIASIRGGDGIATDTTMALSGISKARLLPFGCRVTCHVADPDVAEIARQASITRSIAAMRKAVAAPANRIFVIGNAPTALFELMRLIDDGHVVPSLIIGL